MAEPRITVTRTRYSYVYELLVEIADDNTAHKFEKDLVELALKYGLFDQKP